MTSFLKPWTVVMVALLLLACAAPTTRVILLPESSGKASAVEVKSSSGTQLVSQPYQTAEVQKNGQVVLGTIDPVQVMEHYGGMLAQLPSEDEQFLLYFETGGAQLTAESQTMLPTILERAHARMGGEIIVVGHTDRVGSVEANDALSLQRARTIRSLLIGRGFNEELIDAVGRGERSPLGPTEDGVAEPKNRRAEILIR